MIQTNQDWVAKMNNWGISHTPFFFATDFDRQRIILFRLDDIPPGVLISFPRYSNVIASPKTFKPLYFEGSPCTFEEYKIGFDSVMKGLKRGDSFLVNYTKPTPIQTNWELEDFFHFSSAKYKVCIPGRFTFFSPESFVTMQDRTITSYPMKGTIDASVPDAAAVILNDPKELSEHYTIVDLIRNDISSVAKEVKVPRFRYIEEVVTERKTLLQVSSEVRGQVYEPLQYRVGTIMERLLPAGSISGAPKSKTIEIIKAAERYDRLFYTGICGIFDGHQLDSCVMIRYIEQSDEGFVYKSGGGITYQSNAESEYQELIQKVYVPLSREYKDLQRQSLQYSAS